MSRSKKTPNSVVATQWQLAENTFSWYRNSLQWYEMLSASATTIALRLGDISSSMQKNEIPDGVELSRMVSEKSQAIMKSATAAGRWHSSTSKPWPWPTVLPWQAMDLGVTAAQNLLTQQAQWSKMMLQGFSSTLRPFHSATTANAARLSKNTKTGINT